MNPLLIKISDYVKEEFPSHSKKSTSPYRLLTSFLAKQHGMTYKEVGDFLKTTKGNVEYYCRAFESKNLLLSKYQRAYKRVNAKVITLKESNVDPADLVDVGTNIEVCTARVLKFTTEMQHLQNRIDTLAGHIAREREAITEYKSKLKYA